MNNQSDTVTEVIDGRQDVYGDPVVEIPNVAKVWSGITGLEITAEMVPLMLIGYKLVRARRAPDYSDNSDDIEGYLDIFRKVVGEDMIHARSVSEYLRLKSERPGKNYRWVEDSDEDQPSAPEPGAQPVAVCPECRGVWGTDIMCTACTTADGNPKPYPPEQPHYDNSRRGPGVGPDRFMKEG